MKYSLLPPPDESLPTLEYNLLNVRRLVIYNLAHRPALRPLDPSEVDKASNLTPASVQVGWYATSDKQIEFLVKDLSAEGFSGKIAVEVFVYENDSDSFTAYHLCGDSLALQSVLTSLSCGEYDHAE